MTSVSEFLKNVGKKCWEQGQNDYCGTNGWCCRKGSTGNGCDGSFGGTMNYRCSPKPGTSPSGFFP